VLFGSFEKFGANVLWALMAIDLETNLRKAKGRGVHWIELGRIRVGVALDLGKHSAEMLLLVEGLFSLFNQVVVSCQWVCPRILKN
jgi:hypothetical protein